MLLLYVVVLNENVFATVNKSVKTARKVHYLPFFVVSKVSIKYNLLWNKLILDKSFVRYSGIKWVNENEFGSL